MEEREDEHDGIYSHYNSRLTPGGHHWKNENGSCHRIGAPAVIINYYDMKIAEEHWYIDGMRHRIDGPAIIKYKTDGSITSREWYMDGILQKFILKWLKENNITEPYTDEDLIAIKLRWS